MIFVFASTIACYSPNPLGTILLIGQFKYQIELNFSEISELICRKVQEHFQYGCSETNASAPFQFVLSANWNVAPLQARNREMPQRNVTFDYLRRSRMS